MAGLNPKYFHNGGFDRAKLQAGLPAIISGIKKWVNTGISTPLALNLIERLGADSRVRDVRYIAYMLATVSRETAELRPFTVPVKPPPGKPKPGAPTEKRVRQWVVFDPNHENIGKGTEGDYVEPVKVERTGEGAIITEMDGDQFKVTTQGKFFKNKNQWEDFDKHRNRRGSVFGAKPTDVYNAAVGDVLHYQGRGLVHLTWWDGYANAGIKLGMGLELLYRPERALEPDIAYEVMVRGMIEGWITGATLGKWINDSITNYAEARRVINGTDNQDKIAQLAQKYEDLLMSARLAPSPAKK